MIRRPPRPPLDRSAAAPDVYKRQVQTFAPGRSDRRSIRFQGGGGTDFPPLLEEVQRQRPDIAVVLTDLQGPARLSPACPVIWAVPAQQPLAVPPFGRLLLLQ